MKTRMACGSFLALIAVNCIADDRVQARLVTIDSTQSVVIGTLIVPGGELPWFSDEMIDFVDYVQANPEDVRTYLASHPMNKEIAISLGLIREKWSIDALIAAIPTNDVQYREAPTAAWVGSTRITNYNDRTTMLYYSTIHSLTYATGQGIGRTRRGTYFAPEVKSTWQAWWQTNRESFAFDQVQRTTACARYDGLKRTDQAPKSGKD